MPAAVSCCYLLAEIFDHTDGDEQRLFTGGLSIARSLLLGRHGLWHKLALVALDDAVGCHEVDKILRPAGDIPIILKRRRLGIAERVLSVGGQRPAGHGDLLEHPGQHGGRLLAVQQCVGGEGGAVTRAVGDARVIGLEYLDIRGIRKGIGDSGKRRTIGKVFIDLDADGGELGTQTLKINVK